VTTEREVAKEFLHELDLANDAFDQMCVERHEKGQEKYGKFKFLDVNTLEEALFEVADLANYARYTFVKLWVLNNYLDEYVKKPALSSLEGFVPMSEVTGHAFKKEDK